MDFSPSQECECGNHDACSRQRGDFGPNALEGGQWSCSCICHKKNEGADKAQSKDPPLC